MDDFLYYNGFGFISVSPDKVSVTITAIQGEREITRTVEKDIEALPGIDDTYNFTIGIFMQAGKATRVTVKELSAPIEQNILAIDVVNETIKNAIELVRVSAEPV